MFVIRRKDDNRIFCLGAAGQMAFVCFDRDAAEKAVQRIRENTGEEFGVDCFYEPIDRTDMRNFCFLAYRNGRKFGPESGVAVICRSEAVAAYCAEHLLRHVGKVVRPVPVLV